MHIWHIDDDDLQLELVSLLLKAAQPSATVTSFIDAREAMASAQRNMLPHGLLLDLNMPVMSGWNVLEELQKMQRTMPTWILTSSIDPRDEARARAHTFVKGFIIKPLSLAVAQLIFEQIDV